MTPLGVIAGMVCHELGDNTESKKFYILQLLALGYQKMHLFLNHDVVIKTIDICLDGGHSFELPDDFIYQTKVGIRRAGHNGEPAGPVCVLELNRTMNRNQKKQNDTDSVSYIDKVLNGAVSGECDYHFYNSSCGTLGGYGSGLSSTGYYSIQNKSIHISSGLFSLGDDIELILEYKSDGLSDGLKLVPSEAFLALRYFGKAEAKGEGPYGENRVLWESEYKNLKRLYNRMPIDVIANLFSQK